MDGDWQELMCDLPGCASVLRTGAVKPALVCGSVKGPCSSLSEFRLSSQPQVTRRSLQISSDLFIYLLFVKCFPEHFLLSVFWFFTNPDDGSRPFPLLPQTSRKRSAQIRSLPGVCLSGLFT